MNTRITIGRQFGSSGHEIGRLVAKKLNIKCFDKELISEAAKNSGFCEEMIENHDERPTSSFLYNLERNEVALNRRRYLNAAKLHFERPKDTYTSEEHLNLLKSFHSALAIS